MLLSDVDIREMVKLGRIKVSPLPEDIQYQPISLDLRLGTSWVREVADHTDGYRIIDDQATVRPGEFLLACTRERLILPSSVAGFVHGKSTWARRGLMVEAAGLVDPGFDGTITLELKNLGHHPIPLSAGDTICQITFHQLENPVQRPYGTPGLASKYQGQTRATPAV